MMLNLLFNLIYPLESKACINFQLTDCFPKNIHYLQSLAWCKKVFESENMFLSVFIYLFVQVYFFFFFLEILIFNI